MVENFAGQVETAENWTEREPLSVEMEELVMVEVVVVVVRRLEWALICHRHDFYFLALILHGYVSPSHEKEEEIQLILKLTLHFKIKIKINYYLRFKNVY